MTAPLAWILSTGARSPLGLSTLQVAMCARARKMEPLDSRFIDKSGKNMGTCRMLALPETVWGYDRLLRIASPALCEAWSSTIEEPVPLVLALPEAGRADDDPRYDTRFVRDLAERSRRAIDVTRSGVIRAGHAGGAMAVEAAVGLLSRVEGPAAVMVGGVDSYFHPGVLAALDEGFRLHGPGTEDGFIPSEGAAFALLVRRRPARGGREPLATLRRVVTGREATVGTDTPCTAAAMTALFHALRGDEPIPWVLSDLNGESHRLREWRQVSTRVLVRDEPVHDELVGELGDLGAATGPMLLAIACAYLEAGCAPARDAAIALSSDGPERGALRIGGAP
ncbi:hypothetical protein [Chondromyces crocatus]|uniref:Beta-ketoacyl synthase N-terminal domain-containing protein n=1 Tax=Chondromyces crocatus TaxID=52 RepID=A0A0K1EC74_CHOCO|nr:hypothetical protein [Chondromyces crocatus]AKT38163.1 uncharacterized protein CMC5_023060 [Chondromyces crocatus]